MLPRPPYCAAHRGSLRAAASPQWLGSAARSLGGVYQTRLVHEDARHRYQQHLQRQRAQQQQQQQQQQRPSNPLVNPPASTRPPPLEIPTREPDQAAASYYFNLGKAYIRFYKDGLKSIFRNRRLLRERVAALPPGERPSLLLRPHAVPRAFSRADWVLLWRVRHDMLRLPFFAVMLAVIGELTALVVVFVDGVVPYPCRIPRQVFGALDKAERRRRRAFADLEAAHPHGPLGPGVSRRVARAHVLRSLDLSARAWDRLGPGFAVAVAAPGLWWLRGRLRMAFLEGDDRRLMDDGGPLGLEPDELRIACAERGIDVLGRSETELRGCLSDWLRLTAAEDLGERRRRMATLLLTRPDNWPHKRDFAAPDWEL